MHVISWSDTEIEGLRGAPRAALEAGASWRWGGRSVRVDGPAEILALDDPLGRDALEAHAAHAARKLLGRSLGGVRPRSGPDFDAPAVGPSFTLTDGRTRWTAVLVDVAEIARPLVMFQGALPPAGQSLRVAEGIAPAGHLNRVTDTPSGVICFTRGTRLRTPDGDRAVEDLREGDRIDTRDSGPQDIVWIGRRRMTGARLYAMPELRPVRVRAGALGDDGQSGDLVVSPRHKVLVKGRAADALFSSDEVLVAAEDMTNGRSIVRDTALREAEYVHLLLPSHQIVWANGVEAESFHPASTDLATVDPAQRARLLSIVPGIDADPHGYGAPARRELSRPEAAILLSEAAVGA